MHQIIIKNIRLYAYHGCLEEEAKIGSDYRVDLKITTDFSLATQTDNLTDTVDYVYLHRVVQEEMAIRAELLENVAARILNRFFTEVVQIQAVTIKIAKLNPPIGGDVEAAIIKIKQKRFCK